MGTHAGQSAITLPHGRRDFLAFHELAEVIVAIATISVASVVISLPFWGDSPFHFQVEGLAALKVCVNPFFDSPLLYGSFLLVNIIVGISFFIFSRTRPSLTRRRERTCGDMHRATHQPDNQTIILRKWLKRHVFFGTLLFFKSLSSLASSWDFSPKREVILSRLRSICIVRAYRACNAPGAVSILCLKATQSPLTSQRF